MRVRILETKEIEEAKRYDELTEIELRASDEDEDHFEGDEIFVHHIDNIWLFMEENEYDIVEE
jgi:hypothetical protein